MVVALLFLLFALVRLWPDIGHPFIPSWDESAHQLATRGMHDTGLPYIYRDPLTEVDATHGQGDWLHANVFLHKPTLPFALGALVMWVVGVTTLALRSISFVAVVLTALTIYGIGRPILGRLMAGATGLFFLSLPFGFQMLQGYQFGDVTDCALLGALAGSMWWISRAVVRDSPKEAALAGMACGLGILCKSALALPPLGVLGALVVLGKLGLAPRVRPVLLVYFIAATVLVAAPWNVYCAIRWPTIFWFELKFTLHFMSGMTDVFYVPAIDAVFNKLNEQELSPWPVALSLIAGCWLVWVAFRRRDLPHWVIALWLWGEWIPLSAAKVKAPAHSWGATPALLLALSILLRDAWTRPRLAGTALGALAAPWLVPALPFLGRFRDGLPLFLEQTRSRPGLAEGLLLALAGAAIGELLSQAWKSPLLLRIAGGAATACALCIGLFQSNRALSTLHAGYQDMNAVSFADTLGHALDKAIPEHSVLIWGLDFDPPGAFEDLNLMFYSGRMVYHPREEPLAKAKGYRRYLISSAAQSFERVAAVPAGAWLQAYDLDAPTATPTALPPGVTPMNLQAGDLTVLGIAANTDVGSRGRYTLYVRSDVWRARVPLHFELADQSLPDQVIELGPERSLLQPAHLNGAAWYTLGFYGPKRGDLRGLKLGDQALPLP